MKRLRNLVVCCVTGFVVLLASSSASASFEELVKRIPGTANAIVLFNVEKVHDSPMAIKEKWKTDHQQTFDSGLVVVPPTASRFVLASQIDLEFMEPLWEIIVMNLTTLPSMSELAQRQGVRLERVSDLPAVALRSDAYVVQFDARTVGAMSPANRQNVSRWIRNTSRTAASPLSPYLVEAVGYSENVGTEIIMALDLQDAITPAMVREKVNESPVISESRLNVDQISELVASIRGVTLGIVIRDRPFGKIKVDFQQDASTLSTVVKPLLLEVLAKNGAMIDDFNQWTAKASGNQISIEGFFSKTGMRQVFSIFDPPTGSSLAHTHEATPSESKPEDMAYKSKQYFDSVSKYLDDLRKKKGAKTIGTYGLWFSQYARKIDNLSMLNVDKDMVDYGNYVGQQLRNASNAIKGIGIRSGERTSQITSVPGGGYTQRYGRYGWYGGVSVYSYNPRDELRDIGQARRKVRAQERAQGATAARDIMDQIENETVQIRRTMTERYNMDF